MRPSAKKNTPSIVEQLNATKQLKLQSKFTDALNNSSDVANLKRKLQAHGLLTFKCAFGVSLAAVGFSDRF